MNDACAGCGLVWGVGWTDTTGNVWEDPCPGDPGFEVFDTWFCSEECMGETVKIERRIIPCFQYPYPWTPPVRDLAPRLARWGVWGEAVHLQVWECTGREIADGCGRVQL